MKPVFYKSNHEKTGFTIFRELGYSDFQLAQIKMNDVVLMGACRSNEVHESLRCVNLKIVYS